MQNVRLLTWEEVIDIHRDQLEKHGGQDGFIDEGVVRSAIARPQFTLQYQTDADLADLAADYLFGLATTQGFMDGNKRVALAAASVFVQKNAWEFVISDRVMYFIALGVARGEIGRDELAEILHEHLVELE